MWRSDAALGGVVHLSHFRDICGFPIRHNHGDVAEVGEPVGNPDLANSSQLTVRIKKYPKPN